jgi:hypothetical protein
MGFASIATAISDCTKISIWNDVAIGLWKNSTTTQIGAGFGNSHQNSGMRPLPRVCFRGQSGDDILRRECLLLTQSEVPTS